MGWLQFAACVTPSLSHVGACQQCSQPLQVLNGAPLQVCMCVLCDVWMLNTAMQQPWCSYILSAVCSGVGRCPGGGL
jgi:hypothetical protein